VQCGYALANWQYAEHGTLDRIVGFICTILHRLHCALANMMHCQRQRAHSQRVSSDQLKLELNPYITVQLGSVPIAWSDVCSQTGHRFTRFVRLVVQAHGVTRVVSADGAINNDHALNYLGRAGPIQYTNLGEVDSTSITRVFAHAVQAARDDAACDAGAILVCCKDGTNRSVAVAIVVVMATQGCSLAEAWEMVSGRRVRAPARVCV
jgi:hypothetical protein